MFGPINVPYGVKMLWNEITLKSDVSFDDVEMKLGELCEVVKENYKNDGFVAGQVFKYAGFVSKEGSINPPSEDELNADNLVVIVTYWNSFEQHEKSHADTLFKKHFSELEELCEHTTEVGYDLLWQGEAE